MMPDLGSYAGPVLAAYGVTLGLLACLVGITWRRATRVAKQLAEMERRGG
ncbi:MAG: heme exporter protein CcmD [Pseudomonadota bacterium]